MSYSYSNKSAKDAEWRAKKDAVWLRLYGDSSNIQNNVTTEGDAVGQVPDYEVGGVDGFKQWMVRQQEEEQQEEEQQMQDAILMSKEEQELQLALLNSKKSEEEQVRKKEMEELISDYPLIDKKTIEAIYDSNSREYGEPNMVLITENLSELMEKKKGLAFLNKAGIPDNRYDVAIELVEKYKTLDGLFGISLLDLHKAFYKIHESGIDMNKFGAIEELSAKIIKSIDAYRKKVNEIQEEDRGLWEGGSNRSRTKRSKTRKRRRPTLRRTKKRNTKKNKSSKKTNKKKKRSTKRKRR